MSIAIIQFRGCNKCQNECLQLLNYDNNLQLDWYDMTDEIPAQLKTVILTGYTLLEDRSVLETIQRNAEKVILFGSCATDGGIFGLQNQKGIKVKPITALIDVNENIPGCLGSSIELFNKLQSSQSDQIHPLCDTCEREATCDFLTEVIRQYDPDEIDDEQCLNDRGLLCSGVVDSECTEQCIKFNTPCRGCKPIVSSSGIRMLGMFGTLMGQLEVATEASSHGATDKLADIDDEISTAFLDVVGNFFRFTLANSLLPKGLLPSSGDDYQDIFEKRLLEEIPSIMGMMGGEKFISNTLDILEAYEKANQIEISEEITTLRKDLRQFEEEYRIAIKNRNAKKYKEITEQIRAIGGNMNLSNLGFGGFKKITEALREINGNLTPIRPIDFKQGTYQAGQIQYSVNNQGIITKWKGGN